MSTVADLGEWQLGSIGIVHKGCHYVVRCIAPDILQCQDCGEQMPRTTLAYFMMVDPDRMWVGIKL